MRCQPEDDNAIYLRQRAADIRKNSVKSVDADRLDSIADELMLLRLTLADLANAVAAEVDAKPGFGGSGHLLARLTDARNALSQRPHNSECDSDQ